MLLVSGGCLGSGLQALLLLLFRLRAIFIQKLEELRRGVFVEGVTKLSNCRRNLEALAEDAFLTLLPNVIRPFDKAGQVSGGLNVLTCKPESE